MPAPRLVVEIGVKLVPRVPQVDSENLKCNVNVIVAAKKAGKLVKRRDS